MLNLLKNRQIGLTINVKSKNRQTRITMLKELFNKLKKQARGEKSSFAHLSTSDVDHHITAPEPVISSPLL